MMPTVHALKRRTEPDTALKDLLGFNIELLDQAMTIVDVFKVEPSHTFAAFTGPHLRHVVEHYEALLFSASNLIDYDSRERDRLVEQDPSYAAQRIQGIQKQLRQPAQNLLHSPLQTRFLGGLAGGQLFTTDTNFQRELLFVASHAIHHFAIIQMHCASIGIVLPPQLGRAPATLAYEATQCPSHR